MKQTLKDALNGYLANLSVWYIKLHNLHWNIVGPQFKGVHEYLEELYDGVSESLDEVAELLRMDGELPIASLKAALEVATIEELDSKEISIADAFKILVSDLEAMDQQARAVRELANEEDHFGVAASLEDQISAYTKAIWFVRSMSK